MKRVAITISREYGSGGRIIARRLAEELGISFYDKQLIAEVARRTGFAEHFIQDTEFRRPTNSFIYDLYCSTLTPSVSDKVFVTQTQIIRDIAQRESCIIVGRCADYVLREQADCLRIFVFAPLEERVRRAREDYGVTGEKDLTAYVVRQDKARASYYNYFTTGTWGNSRNYDLCINSRLGIDAAVDTAKNLALSMMRD